MSLVFSAIGRTGNVIFLCVSAERFPSVAKKPKVEAAAYLYGAREALESEVRELYVRYWYKLTNTDT
jgi:hypothetical protein